VVENGWADAPPGCGGTHIAEGNHAAAGSGHCRSGIIANQLRDIYPLPPDGIWTVLSMDYDRAALHPDDLRYEGSPAGRGAAGAVV